MSYLNNLHQISSQLETRLEWPDYFMSISILASTRSPCHRLKVGCIIVRDNRILKTLYAFALSHCSFWLHRHQLHLRYQKYHSGFRRWDQQKGLGLPPRTLCRFLRAAKRAQPAHGSRRAGCCASSSSTRPTCRGSKNTSRATAAAASMPSRRRR